MYSVKCLGAINSSTRSLDRGSCFGFYEKPILFELVSSLIATPLTIRFFLKEDSSQPPVSFVVGTVENDGLDITFFNVKKGESAGLRAPADILGFKGKKLALYFTVDRSLAVDAYTLTYEFFEVTEPGATHE